jgi:peptide deformylase
MCKSAAQIIWRYKMAIRQIREFGDDVLEKKCKPVREMTDSIQELIDDMFETMYEANGVGLAAPQVGILKRIMVIDCTGEDPFVFINPEILETSGEQTGYEGCLSIPGKSGVVTRPNYVRVKALDRDMNEFELEAEELFARAICHECEHLDGHMYVEKVAGGVEGLVDNEELYKEEN